MLKESKNVDTTRIFSSLISSYAMTDKSKTTVVVGTTSIRSCYLWGLINKQAQSDIISCSTHKCGLLLSFVAFKWS